MESAFERVKPFLEKIFLDYGLDISAVDFLGKWVRSNSSKMTGEVIGSGIKEDLFVRWSDGSETWIHPALVTFLRYKDKSDCTEVRCVVGLM